ncbi:MAG TPA: hypothetical protein VFX77_02655 [Rubrobacter sp.]|nr:hypothetical protein [Rubrobacter sp.]
MQGKIAFFSVILLLVGLAIDVCLLTKTGWGDIREAYAQQNCDTVQTFTGNGIKDTQSFTVASDTWRLRYDFESTTEDQQSGSFEMTVYKPGNTIPESIITLERPGTDTSYVNAGAGTYYLSIGSANATWTVDVEECDASAPPGTPNPGPASASGSASTPASTPAAGSRRPKPKPERNLFESGGPTSGPLPLMPNGGCPQEFPDRRGKACHAR